MHAATFAYDFCNAAERKRGVFRASAGSALENVHQQYTFRTSSGSSPPYSSNAAERKRFIQQLQIAKTQALRGSSTRSPATLILPEDVGHDAIESNDLGMQLLAISDLQISPIFPRSI